MVKLYIQLTILAIILIFAQMILSKMVLFGLATPLIYIYVLFRLPMNLSRNWVYTICFLLGLMIDTFNNTQGMNALACLMVGLMRIPVFTIYMPREYDYSETSPSIGSLGLPFFAKFSTTLTLIFCATLLLIQAFSMQSLSLTLARIGASSVLSTVLILCIDGLLSSQREKRL